MQENQIVADRWSRPDADIDVSRTFFGFPPLRPYQIETAYGEQLASQHRDNLFWAQDIFISTRLFNRNIKSMLSLCCGFGSVERHFVSKLPGLEQCVGVDIADGALDVASQRAREAGLDIITYQCADLNNYEWEKDKYDLVVANGALHHLSNLESVFEGIRYTLKQDGMLYANEHVGASYQHYSARQLELINACAYLVPYELRERRGHLLRPSNFLRKVLNRLMTIDNPEEKPEWSRAKGLVAKALRKVVGPSDFAFTILHDSQKAGFLRNDPSEGVRSAEIIPLINEYFTDAEVRDYGGGILAYALDHTFYRSYDPEDSLHRKTLDLLCSLERHFVQTQEIGIEHAIIVARNRTS